MAGKTIKTLEYRVDLDATGFTNGVTATRKELTAARKVMRETISPADKLRNELDKLNHLYKKGVIGIEAYNRKSKQLNETFKKETKSATKFGRAMMGVSTAVKATVAAYISFAAIRGAGSKMFTQIEAMDQLAKTAQTLKANPEFLQGLAFVAQRVSGMDRSRVFDALDDMNEKLGEARVDTTSEVARAFRQIKVDVDALEKATPEQAFRKIAEALREITDEGEQAFQAQRIFGEAGKEMLSTLRLQTDEYDKHIEKAITIGEIRKRNEIEAARRMKLQLDEAQSRIDGLWAQATIATGETISGFQKMADTMPGADTDLGGDMSPMGPIRAWMRDWTRQMLPFPISSPGATPAEKQRAEALNSERKEEKRRMEAQALLRDILTGLKPAGAAKAGGEFVGTYLDLFGNIATAAKWANFTVPKGARTTTQAITEMSDPAESITAGSSEAFKIMNRTKTTKSVEVKLQTKQVTLQEKTATAVTGLLELARSEITEAVNL